MWVIFCGLCVCGTSTAATFSAVRVPLCGYGYYRYGSECRPVDTQSEDCTPINGQSTYRVSHDSTSFMQQEHSELICLGTHLLYEYDDELLVITGSLHFISLVRNYILSGGKYMRNVMNYSGIITNYNCSAACRHCMFASSPRAGACSRRLSPTTPAGTSLRSRSPGR